MKLRLPSNSSWLNQKLAGKSELQKRIATGIVGVAIILGVLGFMGRAGSAVFAVIMSIGMIWEFSKMAFALNDSDEKTQVMMTSVWLVHFFNFIIPGAEYAMLVLFFLVLSGYFLWAAKRHSEENDLTQHFREWALGTFGIFYLGFIPLYLPSMHMEGAGSKFVILFLFIVWTGDTAAYFAGKKWGKRKLYPQISPKKTVEGALGGLAGGVLVALIYWVLFLREQGVSVPGLLITAVLVGAAAQIGDLCESFLKRACRTKDSGSLLPGHGGFLDRFDGVLFGLPVMMACLRSLI